MSKPAHIFQQLSAQIDGDVYSDVIRRCLLATDGSIFENWPAAVAYPACAADVQKIVQFAASHGLSVHARGAGSGLCGAALGDGIVVDFSRYMNRLLHLDLEQGWFECEPGYRLGELEVALKGSGLFFPPDPSSGEYATFGGMCATNASGAHSVKYGNTADYLLDAEAVFADGSSRSLSGIAAAPLAQLPDNLRRLAGLYDDHAQAIEDAYPPVACNVAGYNLRGLFKNRHLYLHRLLAGSEGTLGVLTRLRFRLIRRPAFDTLVVAYCDDIVQAARATQLAMSLEPAGIEIMDKSLLHLARQNDPVLAERIPEGFDNVLLIEFDGITADTCRRSAETLRKALKEQGLSRKSYVAVSSREKARFWALRKAAVPILYKLKGRKKILALVEDAAVPVNQLVPFFQGLYTIFKQHGVDFVLYGHIAKGLLHTRPLLDLKDPGDVELLRVLADAVFELVHGLDGTVSGEHGDGRLRSVYVKRRYPEIYHLMAQAKDLLDPHKILNPEIIIQEDPDQMQRSLRHQPGQADHRLEPLHLIWQISFKEAAGQCHGCSKCTTVTADTRMCPVYKVTRDEAAAPKAKANVLRALISGAVDRQTLCRLELHQAKLQQVMERCVHCGSCFQECPSNVDIPKLVTEAKAQYARRFGVPWQKRMTAQVESAARRLHPLAPVTDALLRIPGVHKTVAHVTGLAAQRDMIAFARRTFYQQFPAIIPGKGPRVLFFVGCYAAYIRPALARAAVSVLEQLGMQIHIPPQCCCGLPHLSKGMVRAARRKVKQNLAGWEHLLSRVDHLVVTCSSCGHALMRDWACLEDTGVFELIKSKVVHVSQLVFDHLAHLAPMSLPVRMAYHQPCHLRLLPGANSSRELLSALPEARLRNLGNHCCGMAGSWGMLAKNYDLSRSVAAPLIGRVKLSDADLCVTDCPTCRMQLEHLGRLPVRHPIEMVWQSLQKS